MWNNALEHDEDYIFDHRLLLPDGQVVWLHVEGETLRDDEGLVIRLFGTMQDITEHRQMEAALRQSEEQYRLIAENTSDGILVLNSLTGEIVYASPAFDLQHGRAIGETQRFDRNELREAIHPDDRQHILQATFDAVEIEKKPIWSTSIVLNTRTVITSGRKIIRISTTRQTANICPQSSFRGM